MCINSTFRAEVCVPVLAQCSAFAVSVVHLLCIACMVHLVHASDVERAPRTCMCTVFSMGRLSDASIVRECACVGVHHVSETCTSTVFGMGGLSDAPIVSGYVGIEFYTVLVLERCALCRGVRERERAHCTCTCTMFGMGNLSST